MKSIVSGGGPLIAMRSTDIPLWGGVDRLNIFRNRSSRENDYEALCDIGANNPYQVTDVAAGSDFDILMLPMPLRTFIVDAGFDHIYIVQIETSEEGWSDHDLRASDFEAVTEWKDPIRIAIGDGPIVLFDSADVASDLRDYEVLFAHLNEGTFLCEWSGQLWPGRARMNFIRLMEQGSRIQARGEFGDQ